MATSINIPDDVEKELLDFLKRLYPEIEASENVYRSISYSPSREANTRYNASVRYTDAKSTSSALFEFSESVDRHGARSYRWYCVRDWRD